MKTTRLVLLILPLLLISACGKKLSEIAKYKEMKNVSEAPETLRNAAKSIVKIRTAAGSGTAFFVNGDLMTNNHVLGVGDAKCAREGCQVDIFLDYQLGVPYTPAKRIFLEPIHVNVEGDVSLFRPYTNASKSQRYPAPGSLELSNKTANQLVGTTVHLIGHPATSVKKWWSGTVHATHENHFETDTVSLPGASGSPYLDDAGRVVGIHHSTTFSNGRITRFDLLASGFGTASSDIVAKMNRNNAELFYSVRASHTNEEIAGAHDAYAMAGTRTGRLSDGRESAMLQLLGEACDAGISKRYASSDEMDAGLAACGASFMWIGCAKNNNDESDESIRSCPSGDEKPRWSQRFGRVAEIKRSFNGKPIPWIVAPWRLEPTKEEAKRKEKQLFDAYVAANSPRLDFGLAFWLITTSGQSAYYQGQNIVSYVRNYRSVSRYEYQYDEIIDSIMQFMSRTEFEGEITKIFADERLMLGHKLALESVAYQLGLLRSN